MDQKYKTKPGRLDSHSCYTSKEAAHIQIIHTSEIELHNTEKSNSLKIKILIKYKIEGKGGAINR